jgi:hypothetical protein
MKKISFPHNKKFAFTIFDDTDGAQIDNIKPIYDLLLKLQIFTTKSVWPLQSTDKNDLYAHSFTLENKQYLNFIKQLNDSGFEIAFHNASSSSNTREKTIEGLEFFKKCLGYYPKSYANHNNNKESLYWGIDRFNSRLLKLLMRLKRGGKDFSQGHNNDSPFFWGDICAFHIMYVRNFVYNDVNIFNINKTLPYHDHKKQFVNFWFSSCDGANISNFNQLISEINQEKLERENGACIVYTHFAREFVKDGHLNETTEILLNKLAQRDGWFVPVSTLLDYLRSVNQASELSFLERLKMEYLWMLSKLIHGTD